MLPVYIKMKHKPGLLKLSKTKAELQSRPGGGSGELVCVLTCLPKPSPGEDDGAWL